jgi:RimJ/RimL family protein N-acetyltransferase
MSWPKPTTLKGKHVCLEPLTQSHHDDLVEAVKDGEPWQLWYTLVPSPESMKKTIELRLALQERGSMLPFAVIEKVSGKALGMTTYLNIDADNQHLEIGATWYARRVQRTAINTEAKLLLLEYAFESQKAIAVEFRAHFFNQQSRRAIERLGARLDGILRNHQIAPNGTLRDTCVYSIINGEWPAVKTHLKWQLEKPRS